jgi:hypothetical protein
MSTDKHEEVTYADDALPRRLVLRVLGAALIIAIALCVLAWGVMTLREHQLRPARRFPEEQLGTPHVVAEVRQAPFEPADPAPSLHEQQRTELGRYRWVDQRREIVAIPIARAMELLLLQPGAQP